MYLCFKEIMLLYNWILVFLSLQSSEANTRKTFIESIEYRLNVCTKEIFKIQQYIDALNSSYGDVKKVKRDVVLSKIIHVDNNQDLFYTRDETFRRNGLREEKKWTRNQIQNFQTDITAQAITIDHVQTELTALRSLTEAIAAEIDTKLVRFNDTLANMSDIHKQNISQCQAQINSTDKRLNELNQQQLIAERKFLSIIDETKASNDKELKNIVEKIGSIENKISLSMKSNTNNFENALTAVSSRTEEVAAEFDINLERLNYTLSNMFDIQKQHSYQCQAQIDITVERIQELYVQQLNASREFQLYIDEAIANKEKELKTRIERVENIETQLSKSVAGNTKGIREEKKWARNRILNILSDITTQAKQIDFFQSVLTAVKSQTEAIAAEINVTGERIQELHVQQLNASREFQLNIDRAIANTGKEIKIIDEKVEGVDTQLSQSLSSNMKHIENKLTVVKSQTEAEVAEMDRRLLEFNGTLSVISDIQKQQNSQCQAFFNNTGERIDEINVQQLTVSRKLQSSIDQAIARKNTELKTIVEQVESIETRLSQFQESNIRNLESGMTAFTSRTESVAAEIDFKLERFKNTMSNMSEIQKQHIYQCQAQIDVAGERFQELYERQLNASREFQLNIYEAIENKDKELKTIVEQVESIKTQLSHSVAGNINGIREEKKWARNRINNILSDITTQAKNIDFFKSELTFVRSQTEAIAAEIDVTGKRIQELYDQQLNASHEFQLNIDKAIANKDEELKVIVEKVESIDTQLSQSLSSNMKHIENKLTVVKSQTEAEVAKMERKLLEFNGTLSVISDIQKQQNSQCQAFFNNTGERIDELNVQQLTVSRKLQSSIDQTIASKDKELKTIVEQVESIETRLSMLQDSNIKNLENELTTVRSRTETADADIEIKLESLNKSMSNMSDIQKQQNSNFQAQIDIHGESINKLNAHQLNVSLEFQLTINDVIAKKDNELKTIVKQVGSIETQLLQLHESNIRNLEYEITVVRSRTESGAAEIDIKLERLNNTMSNISNIQKQHYSHCQTQIDSHSERIHKLIVQQLNASREFQLNIDRAIANKDEELKVIVEKVESIDTQLSQSLSSNMKHIENKLTVVKSQTEAEVAKMERKLLEFNGTLSVISDIQKQQNSQCQAFFNNTGDIIDEFNVQQLTASRKLQSSIDLAIARKDKELKTMGEQVGRIETQLSQLQESNIKNLENELTTVRSRTETAAADTDMKLERLNKSMSYMSDIQKQQNSHCQAQINIHSERINKLNVHQLNASREFQSTINDVIAKQDQELKTIAEKVESFETHLSQSLSNNMKILQNELATVKTKTKEEAAEIDVKLVRFNGSIFNMSDIQKQQYSYCLAQINNTDERLHKLNVHVLTEARDIRSTIDLAKASNQNELKLIQENVKRVEAHLSKSLESNMEGVQKELMAVRSGTEAVNAELEKKSREIQLNIDIAKASNEKEFKLIQENIRRVATQLSLESNIEGMQKELTVVRSKTEAVKAELEKKSREIQLTIDAAKSSNEKELKLIHENLRRVETQLFKSLEIKMEGVQKELAAVRSTTERVSAELETKAREIRSTIDLAKTSNEKELKLIQENVRRVETHLSETHAGTTNLKNEWTAVKSRIESISSAIDTKIERLNDKMSSLSDNLKRLNSQYQAQEDRLNKLSSEQAASCPSGWTKSENDCYFLYGYKATFSEAENKCLQSYSVVAEARSSFENKFLGSFGRDLWLGISNKGRDGNWKVSRTGAWLYFSNWDWGQPGNWEDCAVLLQEKGFKWHDYYCDNSYSFVCRKIR